MKGLILILLAVIVIAISGYFLLKFAESGWTLGSYPTASQRQQSQETE